MIRKIIDELLYSGKLITPSKNNSKSGYQKAVSGIGQFSKYLEDRVWTIDNNLKIFTMYYEKIEDHKSNWQGLRDDKIVKKDFKIFIHFHNKIITLCHISIDACYHGDYGGGCGNVRWENGRYSVHTKTNDILGLLDYGQPFHYKSSEYGCGKSYPTITTDNDINYKDLLQHSIKKGVLKLTNELVVYCDKQYKLSDYAKTIKITNSVWKTLAEETGITYTWNPDEATTKIKKMFDFKNTIIDSPLKTLKKYYHEQYAKNDDQLILDKEKQDELLRKENLKHNSEFSLMFHGKEVMTCDYEKIKLYLSNYIPTSNKKGLSDKTYEELLIDSYKVLMVAHNLQKLPLVQYGTYYKHELAGESFFFTYGDDIFKDFLNSDTDVEDFSYDYENIGIISEEDIVHHFGERVKGGVEISIVRDDGKFKVNVENIDIE